MNNRDIERLIEERVEAAKAELRAEFDERLSGKEVELGGGMDSTIIINGNLAVRGTLEMIGSDGGTGVLLTTDIGGGCVVVRNDSGQIVASLSPDNGDGMLIVRDELGRSAIELSVNRRGGRVETLDSSGESLVLLTASENGGIVRVANKIGKTAVMIFASETGGNVSINNSKAKLVALLSSVEVSGRVLIKDSEGDQSVSLTTDEDGGFISVVDDNKVEVIGLYAADGGVVHLRDTLPSDAALVLSADASGGTLRLHSPTGQPVIMISSQERETKDGEDYEHVGHVQIMDGSGNEKVILTADEQSGSVVVGSGPGEPKAWLTSVDGVGRVYLRNDSSTTVITASDEQSVGDEDN